jgi:hypothetical protein
VSVQTRCDGCDGVIAPTLTRATPVYHFEIQSLGMSLSRDGGERDFCSLACVADWATNADKKDDDRPERHVCTTACDDTPLGRALKKEAP